MKRCMCILLALLLASLCVPALAACPLDVRLSLDRSVFDGPGVVTVHVLVTNTGTDMPGPCVLYDPSGRRVTDFGMPTLAAGESASWSGAWQITEQQLQQGKIVFALAWTESAPDGSPVVRQQPFSAAITRTVTPDAQHLAQLAAAVSLLMHTAGLVFHAAALP